MSEYQFPVEASHVMMFARSIGDDNAAYYDIGVAQEMGYEDVIAAPTFVQCGAHFDPNSKLRPDNAIGDSGFDKADSGGSEGEGPRMHAEQHYEYHQTITAGDILTVKRLPAKTYVKNGKRGGILRFEEYITEYRNQNDLLKVTARAVIVTPTLLKEDERGED